jgi:Rrf2 family nitric oxide-sensitive transcriptional repressor
MRLTKFSEYAFRILIHLASQKEARVSVEVLARRYDISKYHVRTIVHTLGKEDYIQCVQGKGGGVFLKAKPEEINLAQLLVFTENDFYLAECFSGDKSCTIDAVCELRSVLEQALVSFLSVLNQYTLADIIKNKDEIWQKLEFY